jgi:tetratricopeptide (TPR) repeat protein
MALTVLSLSKHPDDWARNQSDLGDVLSRLGQSERDERALEEAIEAYEAASSYWRTEDRFRDLQSHAQLGLADAASALVTIRTFPRSLDLAEKAIRGWQIYLANDILSSLNAGDTAKVQNALGYYYIRLGEMKGDVSRIRTAVPLLEDALDTQKAFAGADSRLGGFLGIDADDAAYTSDTLCRALLNIGIADRDRAALLRAKDLCQFAIDSEPGKREADLARESRENLARVDAALKEGF